MELKIRNESGLPLEYQTTGSAGADLINADSKIYVLKPMRRAIIGTGIFIDEMDSDCEAQIRPRSGLAAKHGITVLNAPGTIDSDYKQEIKVILVNLSDVEVAILPCERIAQIVFNKIEKPNSINVKDQVRIGGFGSTN